MVRRALIGLTALVGVASAQPVPNATWTLPSPRTSPTAEWSADGRYVVLSSDSSVELLDGATLKVLWSRTVSGALPSFLSLYPHPDRAHFSTDSASVYVRTAAGGTYTQFNSKTGDVIRTHTFSDWSGDYVLRPMSSGLLVAAKFSVTAGVEKMDLITYAESDFSVIKTRSETHAYVSGVDFPFGNYAGKAFVGFYGKLVNPRSTADKNWNSGTMEYWNVALDPESGVIQTAVNSGTPVGTQHTNSAGTVDWTNASLTMMPNAAFAKPGTLKLGLNPLGTSIQGFDYTTGAIQYTTDLGLGGAGIKLDSNAPNVKTGKFLASSTAAGNMATGLFLASDTGIAYQNISFPTSGVAGIWSSSKGVNVTGNANYYGLLNINGANVWSKTGNTAPVALVPSTSAAYAAAVLPDHIDILNAGDGSVFASYTGVYKNVLWVSDAKAIAIKADGSADRLDVAAGSVTLSGSLPVMFQSGGVIASNGTWAIGYAGGNIHLYNLRISKDYPMAYPAFTAGWENFFKMNLVSSLRVALLEKNGDGLKWSYYDIASNKLNFVSSVPYLAPASGWPTAGYRGDLSKSAANPVAAFFGANGISTDGTPTSQLKLVRASDGKVLTLLDNIFAAVSDMKFSSTGNVLYVATGGTADNGPADLVALPVPTWLTGISATPSPATGGNVAVKVTLANPAPATKTKVHFTVSEGGATITEFVTISMNGTSGTATLTLPAVAVDKTFTVTANIDGDSETVSTNVVDLSPVPVSFTGPASFFHSNLETLTVTLSGNAPAGGTVLSLSSSNPNLTLPATMTVPEGTKTANVRVGSVASSIDEDGTFTATLGTTSVSCTATALANRFSALTFAPSSVMAGNGSTGTVTLNGKAGPGGVTIALSSSLTGTTVPATAVIAEGDSSTTFPVTTATSSSASAPVVTATYGAATRTGTLTVTQTTISSLTLSPSSVPAGNTSTATVTIGTNATSGGFTIALTYAGTGVSGPSSVTVAQGTNSATYTVTTTAALAGQTASTTATAGASTKTTNLTITPTQVTAFTLTNPSLTGGTASTGTITISAAAPTGGLVVTLTNNNTALMTVPASITVPAGQTSVPFTWPTSPVLASTNVTLTAKIAGAGPTAVQTIIPPKVISVAFASGSVTGGNSVGITVTLDGPAPAGYSITLVSSNTSRMTFVLNPVKPATGATTATATANTTAGAATTVTVTANGPGGNGSATANLNIN